MTQDLHLQKIPGRWLTREVIQPPLVGNRALLWTLTRGSTVSRLMVHDFTTKRAMFINRKTQMFQ